MLINTEIVGKIMAIQDFIPDAQTQSTATSILWAVSLIVAAIGVPQLFKSWQEIREMKYKKISKELSETREQLKIVKAELYETKDALKEVGIIVSFVIPMIKMRNQDDAELMEMIRIFEQKTGINITPKG